MKIAYLSASILSSRAANAVHVMKMARAFVSNDNRVTLFARSSAEPSSADDYQYFDVAPEFDIAKVKWPAAKGVGGVLYAAGVRAEVLRRSPPDMFYGRHAPSLLAVSGSGKPVRLEVHAPPENAFKKLLLARLFAAPCFDRLIVISHALAQEYLRLFRKLPAQRIIVAHDGADPPTEMQGSAQRTHIESLQPDSAGHVGYVGHLYAGKGMELIDALSALMPNVCFHIVGGTEGDIARWRQKTSGRRNLFFHGHVPHREVGGLMAAFDILLAPYQRKVSTFGGKGDIARWMSPLKLFEYMAQAKPIIASDLPVLKEVITDRVNGLLCACDDAAAWAVAVELLLRDQALARSIGVNARNEFLQKYTWHTRAQHVLA